MSGDDTIARYSFLSWLRKGLGASLENTDVAGPRATLEMSVEINAAHQVQKQVALFGPGDVVGIDAQAIIRTDPRPQVMNFEPNYLPLVEFYDEDFPWRYTPAAATIEHRLRPWITLAVLSDDEFKSIGEGRLPVIRIFAPDEVLPPPDQTWAWAHAHANRDVTNSENAPTDELDNLVRDAPDLVISRLLSPRRLVANRGYTAFVIPTFEVGRKAGLGQPVLPAQSGLEAAWGDGQDTFPVYYQWRFGTGTRGDFEYLVRQLVPRTLDARVGIRDMDVQQPGLDLPSITEPPALGLEGALKTVDTQSTPWPDPSEFQSALTELINLPEDAQQQAGHDPIVTPPLYGRWHAGTARLGAETNPPWIEELNSDPRNRTAAGLGTRVVQDQQEQLMASAWQQFGEITEANRRLVHTQLAREVGLSLHARLRKLDEGRTLSFTAPVHARILASPTTVRKVVRDSVLPTAAMDRSFRRLSRPRGPVSRRPGQELLGGAPSVIARLNASEITAALPRAAPTGQVALDAVSEDLTPPLPEGLLVALPWLRWLLLIAAVLIAVFSGLSPVAILALGVGAVAAFVALGGISARAKFASDMRESALSNERIDATPPRPSFRISELGADVAPVGSSGQDSLEAKNFRGAMGAFAEIHLGSIPAPAPRKALALGALRASLLDGLDPQKNVGLRLAKQIGLRTDLPPRKDPLDKVMWSPAFEQPMYEPLARTSSELLLPNVNLITQNTISLLLTNSPFVEAYMVGLNHEMARELLWREFPTDQRGTPMRQFWDVRDRIEDTDSPDEPLEKQHDIKPIHTWGRASSLGENAPVDSGMQKEKLVLVVRGDLFNKYPTAVVFAANAVWPQGGGSRTLGDEEKYPLFLAQLEPDLLFMGFDLTPEEVNGSVDPDEQKPGWFFVIKERPGEPRFGLDLADSPASEVATTWDDLTWGHLAKTPEELEALKRIDLTRELENVSIDPASNPVGVDWGRNSADMAHILYQSPVLIAVHGSEMLPPTGDPQ